MERLVLHSYHLLWDCPYFKTILFSYLYNIYIIIYTCFNQKLKIRRETILWGKW